MNYYPFHLGDYASHTAHLEPMEDLAYRRLLDQYYMREGPLPADIQTTAKLIRMRSMLADVESVLKEFFSLTAAGWMHERCEQVITDMLERQQMAKNKANKRWDMQRAEHSTAPAMPQHVLKHAAADAAASISDAVAMLPIPIPTPIPNKKNTSAVAPPDGVPAIVWQDFTALRKEKKAKLTQTAMDGIKSEAAKAGWTLESALRECCTRGWSGFKADWVAAQERRGNAPPAESFRERDARAGRAKWEEMTGEIHPDNQDVPTIGSILSVVDVTPRLVQA